MAYSPADGRRVFLAYRTVFTGPQAQIRKSKKVREVIEQHRTSFEPLITDFGFDKVADIVKTLLDQCIFQSELKAKIAFPELFKTSPERDVQRNASENDAARSVAEALEELTSASEQGELGEDHQDNNIPEALEPVAKMAPSLYPSYLPYKIQHLILTTVQRQLEECCFDFAAKWFPSLLEENKWDCAESVELTKWIRILTKRCDKLPASAIDDDPEMPLKKVLSSTTVLRHTAVHRLPTSAQGIYKMIQSASRLAQTLGDHSRASELENLHLEIGSRIRDMELNKNFLENKLDEQLQAISEQRAELDRRERDAVATMLQSDQHNRQLIGLFLEEAIVTAFGQPDKVRPIESTNMVNGEHESNRSNGNEQQNFLGEGLL